MQRRPVSRNCKFLRDLDEDGRHLITKRSSSVPTILHYHNTVIIPLLDATEDWEKFETTNGLYLLGVSTKGDGFGFLFRHEEVIRETFIKLEKHYSV